MAYEDDIATSNMNPLESIHSSRRVDRETKREKKERKHKKSKRKTDIVEIRGVKTGGAKGKEETDDREESVSKGGKIDIIVK